MTRGQIINKYYVTKADIQKLLGVRFETAKKLYDKAEEKEIQNEYRAFTNKVQLLEVLKLAGINYKFLKSQIEQEKTA